jgi:hypothetical protein
MQIALDCCDTEIYNGFIYDLFNDAFSSANLGQKRRVIGWLMDNELERMWKEVVVA